MGDMFLDVNGSCLKFFIQKDLDEKLQADLTETITSHGGRVELKVPRAGLVLVSPGSPEEIRLRGCWMNSKDRPDRYFVPYTYVEACIKRKGLLPQVFRVDDDAVKMHIHQSIESPGARARLSTDILHCGGDPSARMENASIILADDTKEAWKELQEDYKDDSTKHVESPEWVRLTIDRDEIIYTPYVRKNPGGRPPGSRTLFTKNDDENLSKWIAAKIPFKDDGKRTGNKLYKELCLKANEEQYSWVSRHTWQSWRERYKTRFSTLDPIIDNFVKRTNPQRCGKGQYGYVPADEIKSKRPQPPRKGKEKAVPSSPQEHGDDEDMWVIKEGDAPLPKWGSQPKKQLALSASSDSEYLEEPTPKAKASGSKKRPAEEDEEGETSSTPRKSKKAKLNPELTESTLTDVLCEIATECKFTLEEVREYYDRKRDLDRTRKNFQGYREVITAMQKRED